MKINSIEEYREVYKQSVENPEAFWDKVGKDFLWKKPYDKVLEWNFDEPKVEWFINGKLNITENALDRHVAAKPEEIAIIWEPNDIDDEPHHITYKVLHERVCRLANVMKKHGVVKGDRVCIYLPMIPELAISVLACARIGAIHSVIFGGFSAKAIADRVNDAQCKMIITSDGGYRGTKKVPMKETVDDALIGTPSVKSVLVATRTRTPVSMIKNRDYWWEDEVKKVDATCAAEEMDSEDPLFILYTSGSTGQPKGVVHTCGGYMVYTAYTFQNVFQYKPGQVYFCTADIGWITGHSYIVYGPLISGATSVMFEGVPTFPDAGRFWDIVERHNVHIFYTAPTAIRALMGHGDEYWQNKDLSSLKVLGSVGEPINEEAWRWYDKNIGKGNCTICDTWWQTETGGIMISPIANVTPTKPAFATLPFPGVQPVLVDEKGEIIEGNGVSGNLCIKFPWPSIVRTIWGDHERCKSTYFSAYPQMYFTGDGCSRDEDGYYRITGRVDDVINVSGHRIGTAEVEDALNSHTGVIESAVVGYPHDIKGQGIYAYIVMEQAHLDYELTRQDILATVTRIIGAIAKPDKIQFVSGLPKTRSGKIMRRILRKIAEGSTDNFGDTSTLLDPSVIEEIIAGALV